MATGSIIRTTSQRARSVRPAQAARHDAWGWLGRSLAALLDVHSVRLQAARDGRQGAAQSDFHRSASGPPSPRLSPAGAQA